MQRRILYIINPISGTKNKSSIKEVIAARTEAAGFGYDVFPSIESGDYSFLHPVIKENNITDVVIAGGDGTINAAVKNLRSLNVQFGILPCGSGNGLALTALIPRNIDKALEVVFKGKSELTDAFLVNDRFACMLCGLGFDAQVAHDFANDPKRGLATYIQKTVMNFFSAKIYLFEVKTKQKKIKTEAFFISIANSNQFGNNFKIAPMANLRDGLLDVVIVVKQNKFSVLWNTIRQVGGFNQLQELNQINDNTALFYFQTDELQIKNISAAPMHIDGDPAETEEKLKIKILPSCFQLIYP